MCVHHTGYNMSVPNTIAKKQLSMKNLQTGKKDIDIQQNWVWNYEKTHGKQEK